jgi:hypothetical protein
VKLSMLIATGMLIGTTLAEGEDLPRCRFSPVPEAEEEVIYRHHIPIECMYSDSEYQVY